MIIRARRQLHSRTRQWLLYPVLAALTLASVGGGYETVRESVDAAVYPMPRPAHRRRRASAPSVLHRLGQSHGDDGTRSGRGLFGGGLDTPAWHTTPESASMTARVEGGVNLPTARWT